MGSATVPVAPAGVPPDGFVVVGDVFSGTLNTAGGTPALPMHLQCATLKRKWSGDGSDIAAGGEVAIF